MMQYIVMYEDSMYSEDNRIVGIRWSYDEAENLIISECKSNWDANYPNKHTSNAMYYDIKEEYVPLPESMVTAIKDLYKIASLVNVGQAVNNNEVCDILGLNPWAINEGRASGNEKISLSKIKDILEDHDIDLK